MYLSVPTVFVYFLNDICKSVLKCRQLNFFSTGYHRTGYNKYLPFKTTLTLFCKSSEVLTMKSNLNTIKVNRQRLDDYNQLHFFKQITRTVKTTFFYYLHTF